MSIFDNLDDKLTGMRRPDNLWGEPLSVKMMARETGCDIVVSSTWRLSTMLSELRGRLIAAGMRPPVPIIDRTAYLGGKRGALRSYAEAFTNQRCRSDKPGEV